MKVQIEESWRRQLQEEFDKPYFEHLVGFVKEEYARYTVFPPGSRIFHAYNTCPFEKVKVVILGQDPYHEPGQYYGLCFSVMDGVPFPPSLVNIFKEIQNDLGKPIPCSGRLERWADQGVLLINAILHFRQQKKYSEMLDLLGKMVPNLPNEALKVRYDATLGRLQDMNETEKKQAIAYLKERMAGMTGSTLERYRQIVTELSDYQGIRFETGGLQEALAKARKENKAVFVDCYTSWCGPCKMMSSKVFPDKQAGDFFNPRFISLKIDMEKDEGKELAQKWNIRVFPTYLILDPQGEIVYTSQGYIPAEELIRRMNEGLEQWKNNIKTGK